MNTLVEAPVFSSMHDDPDFQEMLVEFIGGLASRQAELIRLFHEGDLDQVKQKAHQLKGAGGGYGFDGLTDAAASLEQACKAGDVDGVGQALDGLLNYVSRIAT